MKKILSFVLLAVALAVASPLTAQPLAAAGANEADPEAELLDEGWAIVHQGVLQKQHEDGRLSTLAYGVEGSLWIIHQLESELGRMMVDFERAPSASLEQAIVRHRRLIAEKRQNLELSRARGDDLGLEALQKSCTVTYDWSASADPGAEAAASASFSASGSGCPTGAVYAHAYCSKTVWGTTTTETETDPEASGSTVSGSASCDYNVVDNSADSTRDCDSYANAYVEVSGVTYQESDTDTSCLPALSVSASSPQDPWYVIDDPCVDVLFSAYASGGTGGYSYDWEFEGSPDGTDSSWFEKEVCQTGDYTAEITVTDSDNRTATDEVTVTVTDECDKPMCVNID